MCQLSGLVEMDEVSFKRLLDESLRPVHQKLNELANMQRIEFARAANGRKGMTEQLEPVPRVKDGKLEHPPVFPATLQHIVVGGSELAPDSRARLQWNIGKSRDLIRFYDDEYESEFEGRDDMESSRQKRLRVARMIGVTSGQMSLVAQASFA